MKDIAKLLNKRGIGNAVKVHTTCPAEVRGRILFHSEEFTVIYVTDGFADNIPRLFVVPSQGKGNTIEAVLDILRPSTFAEGFASELLEKSSLDILMEALVGKAIFPKLAPFNKISPDEVPEVINDGNDFQILQFDIVGEKTTNEPRIDRFEIVPKDKKQVGFTVVTRMFPDNSEATRLREILTNIKV